MTENNHLYDPLFVRFLYDFNWTQDYFECHESLEELWLEEAKEPLYQGLLQVAVALYHHRNGNLSGAIKLMTSALDKLKRYPDVTHGIDLAQVQRDGQSYLEKLLRNDQEPFNHEPFDIVILDHRLQEELDQMIQSEEQN